MEDLTSMKEQALMSAVFELVEHLTKSELTNIAKTLIYNYFSGSERPTTRERAREAVFRYAQCKSLPTLNEIRKKTREQLDKLEHLVLRMEYEGMRLDGFPPLFQAPEEPTAKKSGSPPGPPPPQSGTGPFRVKPVAEDTVRSAAPAPLPATPAVRRSTLVSGSFAGVKAKKTPTRASKPGTAPKEKGPRHPKAKAPGKTSASSVRRTAKKLATRSAAKKTSARKKRRR
jgi:hypothetical protein